MGKVKMSISMSLDGCSRRSRPERGESTRDRGEELHEWVVPLRAFREGHGKEGGEVNASTPIIEEILGNVGAVIMGRNMFGGGPGPWGDDLEGLVGRQPAFHTAVFVLTHHAREPLELQGGTTFYFVTMNRVRPRAGKAAAGDRDVSVGGGAGAAQRYLASGLPDETVVSIVPVILGGGARLFDNLGDTKPSSSRSRRSEAPGVTHIRYARV